MFKILITGYVWRHGRSN